MMIRPFVRKCSRYVCGTSVSIYVLTILVLLLWHILCYVCINPLIFNVTERIALCALSSAIHYLYSTVVHANNAGADVAFWAKLLKY